MSRRLSADSCTCACALSTERRTRPHRSSSQEASNPVWNRSNGAVRLVFGMPPCVPPSPFAWVPGEPPLAGNSERTPFALSRSRVYEALPFNCGNRSARVTPSCARLSASRMPATRTSRLASATRCSSEVSSGSLNTRHQSGSGGAGTGALCRSLASTTVGRPANHEAGEYQGAGLWKSGPMVQPPAISAPATAIAAFSRFGTPSPRSRPPTGAPAVPRGLLVSVIRGQGRTRRRDRRVTGKRGWHDANRECAANA